jgi:hypothetical protein
VNRRQDPYGNWLARCLPGTRQRLKIEVDVVADMTSLALISSSKSAENWPFEYRRTCGPISSSTARLGPPVLGFRPLAG